MTFSSVEASNGVIAKDGRRLTSLEEWHSYAPPKGRTHWKDGRSAKKKAQLVNRMRHLVTAAARQARSLARVRGALHIQTVNSRHSEIKGFLRAFRGIATKNLDSYLRWFHLIELGDRPSPRACLAAATARPCLRIAN